MATNEEVNRRRKELALLIFQGMDKQIAFEQISEKHGIAASTARKDWAIRNEWLRKVFDIENVEEVTELLLSEQRFIRDEYMKLMAKAKSESTKLGCMNGIRETNKEMLSMMESLGIIEKQPDKLEVEGEIKLTSLAKEAEKWEEDES